VSAFQHCISRYSLSAVANEIERFKVGKVKKFEVRVAEIVDGRREPLCESVGVAG
jgi:hypothetical protein